MSETLKEARQLYLFDDTKVIAKLDARLWHGSFNSRESSLQQLSPYVGKMKSGMARVLIHLNSKPGDVVLDPFVARELSPLKQRWLGGAPGETILVLTLMYSREPNWRRQAVKRTCYREPTG